MGKKLFKKLLSGAAASMMMFGAAPKSNTKAMRHSSSSSVDISVKTKNDVVATCVAGVVLAALAVGVGVAYYFENKAWKKELNERENSISGASGYIKNLASSLKEIIPRSNSKLFNSLVSCQNYQELQNWKYEVCDCDNLSSSTLGEIIKHLRRHWRTDLKQHSYHPNYAAYCADMEVWPLREKYNRLVDEERWKDQMEFEKKRLDIERKKFENYPSNTGAKVGNNIVINNNYYQPPAWPY